MRTLLRWMMPPLSTDGIMNTSASRAMIQCAIDCSRYCNVLLFTAVLDASGWKRRADTPILSAAIELQRRLEDAFEIRACASPRICLVADIVHGDIEQLRQLCRGNFHGAKLRWYAYISFERGKPLDESCGGRLRRFPCGAHGFGHARESLLFRRLVKEHDVIDHDAVRETVVKVSDRRQRVRT